MLTLYAIHLDKLTKVNNKILRILQNKSVLTPTIVNYIQLTVGLLFQLQNFIGNNY
jgi:hypothetical protein